MIKTREDYLESLKGMKKRIFLFGEEIEDFVDHPMIKPSLNAVARGGYDLRACGRPRPR
jgi:4-hydroxybutyryl-CoA dehydratase/vinylacetyl-CoA-Delta-isomerase